jgi:hypothetical protein
MEKFIVAFKLSFMTINIRKEVHGVLDFFLEKLWRKE